MLAIDIQDAKLQLASLIEEAAKGSSFIILSSGKPIIKIEAIQENNKPKRKLGFLRGKFKVPENFNEIHKDDIVEIFEGK